MKTYVYIKPSVLVRSATFPSQAKQPTMLRAKIVNPYAKKIPSRGGFQPLKVCSHATQAEDVFQLPSDCGSSSEDEGQSSGDGSDSDSDDAGAQEDGGGSSRHEEEPRDLTDDSISDNLSVPNTHEHQGAEIRPRKGPEPTTIHNLPYTT